MKPWGSKTALSSDMISISMGEYQLDWFIGQADVFAQTSDRLRLSSHLLNAIPISHNYTHADYDYSNDLQ